MKLFAALASLFGLVAVALGAFGAHGLKNRVQPALLEVWQTAVHYQMFHVMALFVVTFWLRTAESNTVHTAGWLFVAGTLLFSGSLYALVLTGTKVLGAVTPIGGLLFLAGWGCLLLAAIKD